MRIIALALLVLNLKAPADSWSEAKDASKASLTIEHRLGEEGSWKPSAGLSIKSGQNPLFRVRGQSQSDVRWYQIIPDISRFYKNANHPWEENAYQWVGFGKIDYKRVELKALRGKMEVQLFGHEEPLLIAGGEKGRTDLGTFWLQAEVLSKGLIKRSPGLKEVGTKGLSLKTCRLSIRSGDDYLGHLSGFFNVPGIFGSVPYQSHNYLGVDCADVLVAAYGKWKKKKISKDYNVAMLVNQWPKVTSFKLENGKTEREIKWGENVRAGDLIAVRYPGRKRYQHIGALSGDTNKDGLLNGSDTVIHAGPEALHFTALSRGSFDGEVTILRRK